MKDKNRDSMQNSDNGMAPGAGRYCILSLLPFLIRTVLIFVLFLSMWVLTFAETHPYSGFESDYEVLSEGMDAKNEAFAPQIELSPSHTVSVRTFTPAAIRLMFTYQVAPNRFYYIDEAIYLNHDDVRTNFIDGKKRNIFMTSSDYNGNVIRTYPAEYSHGFLRMKRVIKSDSMGKIRLTVHLGSGKHGFSGSARIENSGIRDLSDNPEYTLLSSRYGKVRMVFRTDDLKKTLTPREVIQNWMNLLEGFRDEIREFVGGAEPYSGTTDYILTEIFPYYGLAGNPIYMNQEYVCGDLNKISLDYEKRFSNLLWGYIHEMSHTFDGFDSETVAGHWCFDSEFFANLKTVYVLEKNGYKFKPDSKYSSAQGQSGALSWAMSETPTEAQSGAKNDAVIDYFKKSDTLKNSIYSSNGMLYSFCRTLDEYYGNKAKKWDALRKVMIAVSKSSEQPEDSTQKFRLFLKELNQELGCDYLELLDEKERKAVLKKFSPAIREKNTDNEDRNIKADTGKWGLDSGRLFFEGLSGHCRIDLGAE